MDINTKEEMRVIYGMFSTIFILFYLSYFSIETVDDFSISMCRLNEVWGSNYANEYRSSRYPNNGQSFKSSKTQNCLYSKGSIKEDKLS